MTDDIAAMTLKLAQDPASLVFLALAESLRKRGQLEAALTVATRGSARYPELADGHDLVARIQSDRGAGDEAFDAWTLVLRLTPDHLGAHKGLAFLSYRNGRALCDRSITKMLAGHLRALGAPAWTSTHSLRRKFANDEIDSETEYRVANKLGGIIIKIANEPATDILSVRPDLPPGLVAFLDKAMTKDSDQRFQTGDEYAAALRAAFSGAAGAPAAGGGSGDMDISL